MTDKEFDLFLEETMDCPPPVELSNEFTPWRAAMSRIIWGIVWTTVTFNFWYLDVTLPAVGWMMQLLGYRALRRENKWFRMGYVLSWIRLLWWFVIFSLRATIYGCTPAVVNLLTIGSHVMAVPGFLILVALRNGIRTVQKKTGLPPHGGNWLLVWYLVFLLHAMFNYGGLLAWGVLIVHICILRNLYTLSGALDEAGYAVSPAPVRISDSAAKRLCVGAMALALVIGYGFFGSYRMDWQRSAVSETPEVQTVRQEMLELGFPAHILEDLTDADILACKGAVRIVVNTDDHPINDGRQVYEQQEIGMYSYTVYDQKELRITGIAVELPGQQEQWKIIHHFQWVIDPGFRGTEVLHLWPAYQKTEAWASSGELSGQILYDQNGQRYAAPFYSLGHETYTQDTIFWGPQTMTDVFAEFSMPNSGENHRGYISYTIAELQDGWMINAWINYTHQTPWPQYPVMTAREKHQMQGVSDTLTFITVQDALQFFPGDEDPVPLD